MWLKRVLVLAAALAALVATRASASTFPVDTTAMPSGDSSLLSPLPAPVALSGLGAEAVSRDGNLVVFSSVSDGLSNQDDDAVDNVYVKNTSTGAVTLVSRASGAAGAPATQDCFGGAISADGNRVAFTCDGALDPADTNNDIDVYVRDLTTDQTILVSRQSAAAGGAVGAGGSSEPSLSHDGQFIAFASEAHNLSSLTRSGIYVRDLTNNTTTLASVADDESLPNGDSFDPSISDAGDRVAFMSDASNLVPGDDNGHDDVFVRSLHAGTTELVSKQSNAAGGKVGNGFSEHPVISGNGEVVAFDSSSTNFDDRDHQTDLDVYKHDLSSNTTTLVDTTATTKLSDGATDATIDDHGDAIAFETNGPSRSGNTVQVAQGGTLTVVHSVPPEHFFLDGFSSLSGDGAHVVYRSDGGEIGIDAPGVPAIAMRDLPGSTVRAVSTPGSGPFNNLGGESETPSVSADGRFVAFATAAPALGVPSNSVEQVVVRDMSTGAVTLVSREDGPDGAPMDGRSDSPSISADGTHVAFAQTQPNGLQVVWVRDLTGGRTVLVSRATGADGATANNDSFNPSIDANGGRVAFESTATNLDPGDTKDDNDIYVRDLGTNQTILASVGVNGQKGDEESRAPSISGDGHHVAFFSSAKNLGDGDTDPMSDVHVRDIDAGTTRLASVSSAGEKGDSDSEHPSISADGSRVAFESSAGNFGVTSNVNQVWVHDFSSGSTTLVSRADGAVGALGNNGSFSAVISPDGNFVAFDSEATNLTADNTNGADEIFRRDLTTNTTRLASRASGATGAPASDFAELAGISSQGACVVFEADGGLLGSVAGANDFDQVYLRAFGPNCPAPAAAAAPPPRDTTPPVLRKVSLTHTRFRVAKGRTSVIARTRTRIPRGTVLSFTVSEPARLTIVIERRRVRRHGRRHRVSFVRVARLTRGGVKAGPGRVELTGRIGRRRMAAGAYRLTLTAQDAAGNRSKPARRSFTILPG